MRPESKARLEAAMAAIADVPLEQVLAARHQAADDVAYFAEFKGRLDAEIARRMAAEGQTLAFAGGFEAEITRSKSYQWDGLALHKVLREHLSPALLDELIKVVPPPKPVVAYETNTRKVNGLKAKVGPGVWAEIEACCTVTEGNPKVDVRERGTGSDGF